MVLDEMAQVGFAGSAWRKDLLRLVEVAGQAVQTTARDHPFYPVRTLCSESAPSARSEE
jgi:hypothetical protein